ncbi:MAG: HicB family protein [Firmicutes bacterium HGW-Firmicutes-15]|nr:MAG: HicB family protein [Firmicutes bacterium HGW-Firmicutes-15]
MSQNGLLTSFMLAAMKQVTEEKLDDGSIYCEIPSCPGVWANEDTLQECIIELRQALELWLFLKIKDNDPLPVLNGIDLNTIGSEFIETDE